MSLALLPVAAGGVSSPAVAGEACPADGLSTSDHVPETTPAGARPVVLVHGWNGSKKDLAPMRTVLSKTGKVAYYAFDYSPVHYQWASRPLLASCLSLYMLKISNAYRRAHGDGRLIVLAHSMGGLVARFATEPAYTETPTGSILGGLIALATPHQGSSWGSTADARLMEVLPLIGGSRWQPLLPAPAGTDAGICLAPHDETTALGHGCATPPYLPASAALAQIAGRITLHRTLFNVGLYDIDMGGDSIVPLSSGIGYLGSGPVGAAHPSMISISTATVPCTVTTDQLGAIAAAQGLLGGGLQGAYAGLIGSYLSPGMLTDPIAMESLLSGHYSLAVKPLLISAELGATCSHVGLLKDIAAQSSVAKAMSAMLTDLAQPRLSTDGYGPVQFGMTVAEAEAALGTTLTDDGGGNPQCTQLTSTAAPGLTFAAAGGKVVAAAVAGGSGADKIRTLSGIKVGTTVEELNRTVPGMTHRPYASAGGYTEFDLRTSSGRAASFLVEDATGHVTSFSFGDPNLVVGVEFLCV